ncbi:hypothetical protein ACRRTK_004051 [Alexandromys fortis]
MPRPVRAQDSHWGCPNRRPEGSVPHSPWAGAGGFHGNRGAAFAPGSSLAAEKLPAEGSAGVEGIICGGGSCIGSRIAPQAPEEPLGNLLCHRPFCVGHSGPLSSCAAAPSSVRPARTRFHLPRRREPGGGGDPPSQPMSDVGAGSCRYKGLGAAAVRPRARSAQRGPEGGRAGGRQERTRHPTPGTRHPAPGTGQAGPRAHHRTAEILVEKGDLSGPRGAAHWASSTARPLPQSTCRWGPDRRRAHPQARVPALEGAAASVSASAASATADARAGPRREHRAPPKECTNPGAALDTDRARRAHKNGHCRYSLVAARRTREGGAESGSTETRWGG